MLAAPVTKPAKKPWVAPRVRSEKLDAPVLFAASGGNPKCPPQSPAPVCQ